MCQDIVIKLAWPLRLLLRALDQRLLGNDGARADEDRQRVEAAVDVDLGLGHFCIVDGLSVRIAVNPRAGPVVVPAHRRQRHRVVVQLVRVRALGHQQVRAQLEGIIAGAQVEGLAVRAVSRKFEEQRPLMGSQVRLISSAVV